MQKARFLLCIAILKVGIEAFEILGWELCLESRHLVSKRTFGKSEYFMKPGRQICLAGSYVPVPQSVVGAARRKRIALFAQAQLLEGSFSLYCPADDACSSFQDVDFGTAPLALDLAIVESEKPPP